MNNWKLKRETMYVITIKTILRVMFRFHTDGYYHIWGFPD